MKSHGELLTEMQNKEMKGILFGSKILVHMPDGWEKVGSILVPYGSREQGCKIGIIYQVGERVQDVRIQPGTLCLVSRFAGYKLCKNGVDLIVIEKDDLLEIFPDERIDIKDLEPEKKGATY